MSNKAKNKLQSLFKAQGIEKPDNNTLLTSAKTRSWTAKVAAQPAKIQNGPKETTAGSSLATEQTKHRKVDGQSEKAANNKRKRVAENGKIT